VCRQLDTGSTGGCAPQTTNPTADCLAGRPPCDTSAVGGVVATVEGCVGGSPPCDTSVVDGAVAAAKACADAAVACVQGLSAGVCQGTCKQVVDLAVSQVTNCTEFHPPCNVAPSAGAAGMCEGASDRAGVDGGGVHLPSGEAVTALSNIVLNGVGCSSWYVSASAGGHSACLTYYGAVPQVPNAYLDSCPGGFGAAESSSRSSAGSADSSSPANAVPAASQQQPAPLPLGALPLASTLVAAAPAAVATVQVVAPSPLQPKADPGLVVPTAPQQAASPALRATVVVLGSAVPLSAPSPSVISAPVLELVKPVSASAVQFQTAVVASAVGGIR
jgi:hypothetical protein